MNECFAVYGDIFLFLHIFSAIVWVGGMIAIRFVVHPTLQTIENPQIRIEKTLEILRKFFQIVIPMIVILIFTAVLLSLGLDFKAMGGSMYAVVHVKEGIWSLMSIFFIVIYVRRNRAQKAFEGGDMIETKKQLTPIAKYFIPANILLGLVALYLGGFLRSI